MVDDAREAEQFHGPAQQLPTPHRLDEPVAPNERSFLGCGSQSHGRSLAVHHATRSDCCNAAPKEKPARGGLSPKETSAGGNPPTPPRSRPMLATVRRAASGVATLDVSAMIAPREQHRSIEVSGRASEPFQISKRTLRNQRSPLGWNVPHGLGPLEQSSHTSRARRLSFSAEQIEGPS